MAADRRLTGKCKAGKIVSKHYYIDCCQYWKKLSDGSVHQIIKTVIKRRTHEQMPSDYYCEITMSNGEVLTSGELYSKWEYDHDIEVGTAYNSPGRPVLRISW